MPHRIREGETGNQDFTLRDENGVFDGSTATGNPVLILKDRSGAAVDMTNKVAWLVAASGTVRVNPGASDLMAEKGPYTATFIVTVSSKTYAFPSTAPDSWVVWK